MPSSGVFSLPQTIADVARLSRSEERTLIGVASSIGKSVRVTKKPKRSGGYRKITAPNESLKKFLRTLDKKVLSEVTIHNRIYLRPGSSHARLALDHLGHHFLLTADIDDFFPSVTPSMVQNQLEREGFGKEAAGLLTRLTTLDHELPQGFPTSSRIAAIVLRPVMDRLERLAFAHKMLVGVYADNLVVSSNSDFSRFHNLLARIFRQSGFKLEKFCYMFGSARKEIMGLVLAKNGLEVLSEYIEQLEKELRNLGMGRNSAETHALRSLRGKINYVDSINKSQGNRLKCLANLIRK